MKKGAKHSPETIEKIKFACTLNPTRYWSGKKLSEEHKRKIGIKSKGRHQSKATRRKRSESLKGHSVTEETKEKIRKKNIDKKVSKSTRQRLSKALEGNSNAQGHIISKKTREQISEKLKGRKLSEETKRKMSKSRKGKPGRRWTEKEKLEFSISQKGRKRNSVSVAKMAATLRGRPSHMKGKTWEEIYGKERANLLKIALSKITKGKPLSDKIRIKLSIAQGGDGDIERLNRDRKITLKDKVWRRKVFKRDDYECQLCHQRGGQLNAHHIYPKALYPKRRYLFKNGITLCADCHDETKGKEYRFEIVFKAIARVNRIYQNKIAV